MKNPHVELQDGATKRDYLAREVTGKEKALWWERAVEAWPDYAGYQKRTERQIPVFVLDPKDSVGGDAREHRQVDHSRRANRLSWALLAYAVALAACLLVPPYLTASAA